MFRYMIGILFVPVFLWGGINYVRAQRAYDPEKACDKQTQMTREMCLNQVHFAQSAAGW